jgi:hypothetical protein
LKLLAEQKATTRDLDEDGRSLLHVSETLIVEITGIKLTSLVLMLL